MKKKMWITDISGVIWQNILFIFAALMNKKKGMRIHVGVLKKKKTARDSRHDFPATFNRLKCVMRSGRGAAHWRRRQEVDEWRRSSSIRLDKKSNVRGEKSLTKLNPDFKSQFA